MKYCDISGAGGCGLRNHKIAGYRGIVHHHQILYRYTSHVTFDLEIRLASGIVIRCKIRACQR